MADRLVTIATYQEPVAAALAKNFLESQGITATLFDEATIATDWMLSAAIGGIKLKVAPLNVERAEMLLTQIQADRDEAHTEEPIPHTAIAAQEIAEDLHAERIDREPINQLTDRVFRAAVAGVLFWPLQLYALYLLMEISATNGKVSPDRRWKLWVSVCFAVIGIFGMLFLSYFAWGV